MTQLHFIPVDLGSPIVHCSVADPYVVIMTAEGVVTMFALKTDSYMGKTHRLALQKPQIPTVSKPSSFDQHAPPPLPQSESRRSQPIIRTIRQLSRVIALCAYRDVSGMFTTENKVSSSFAKEDAAISSLSEAETVIHDLR